MPQKRSSSTARASIVENFAICMSNSPPEIWLNINHVFYPTGSSAKKRKSQAATEPDNELTSSMSSDSSSTVETSGLEGKEEKDLILPDYISDELLSSDSSASEPEDASMRISEQLVRESLWGRHTVPSRSHRAQKHP